MSVFERRGNDVLMIPGGVARGGGRPPGSKSLTNRALFCAALADGVSTLTGASLADDAHRMIAALQALGISVEVRSAQNTVIVRGRGGHLPATGADLDAGPAGTAMRFLTALCALGHGRFRLDGSPRMRARPIGDLVDALRDLGATIGYEQNDGYPPLAAMASGLTGGRVVLRRPASSQFVSAVLMAAPRAAQDVLIDVRGALPSRPYLDMTIDLMRAFGVELLAEQPATDNDAGSVCRIVVPAPQVYQAREYTIEPDASAATYFWAAAAITGGRVQVAGLTRGSRQGDARFVDVLARMGCRVEDAADGLAVAAPPDGRLSGIDVDLNAMPDTVQTLAAVALFADGPTCIRNVANLRVKETDRIAALERELAKFGARIEADDDGLTIHPPRQWAGPEGSGIALDTYDDHRMAMSMALIGLRRPGVLIRDAGCVSKSFPDYFEELSRVFERAAQ